MLVVFDWDGTLMDSTDKIIVCMQKAADDLRLPPLAPAVVANIIGLGLPEAIRTLYPDILQGQAEQLRLRYSEHFVHLDNTPMPLFAGVAEGLAKLQDLGVLMAVATGKSRRGLDRILTALDMLDIFVATRCADETASKPHPLMLQELLAVTRRKPEQAIMVGDTEYDMAMAEAIAVPRIAVSYGAHHIDRLKAYQPALCADNFSQVQQWILARWAEAF